MPSASTGAHTRRFEAVGALERATRACVVAGCSHHEWLDGVPKIRTRFPYHFRRSSPAEECTRPPEDGSGGRRCCGVLGGIDCGVGWGAGAARDQVLTENVGFGVDDGEVGGFGHLAFGRGDQEVGLGLDR